MHSGSLVSAGLTHPLEGICSFLMKLPGVIVLLILCTAPAQLRALELEQRGKIVVAEGWVPVAPAKVREDVVTPMGGIGITFLPFDPVNSLGVQIDAVIPDSPAAKAGLKKGMVITMADDTPL